MKELILGIVFIVIGYLAGLVLRENTKEELKQGKKWFNLIILISAVGAIVGLILGNDATLFTFLFFVAVTLPSLNDRI